MTARVRHRRVFEGAALDIRYDGNRARRPAVARFELGACRGARIARSKWERERGKFKVNRIAQRLKIGIVSMVVVLAASDMASGCVSSAGSPTPASCAAPEYRQFDFWAGDWDAFEIDGSTPVARIRVDRLLDGCVLREVYEDTAGLRGESFSIYDASRKLWHQSWVTNRGQLLVIEGRLETGEMVLSGVDHTAEGGERHVRGTWKPVNEGARETAVTSTDGGKTWKPWFDLLFRPHRP